MFRRNPYYIQDNIRLDLRDSKGRFAPPSRAKKFYLYVDDDLVRVGEFARVSDPVWLKEEIITDAISEIYEELLEDVIDQEIIPEDFEEPSPVPEEEEPSEPEGDDELAELLLEDLLREIAESDPIFFQEITGELPPIKGTFEEKYKEFETWSLGGKDNTQPGVAVNQIFKFELDKGVRVQTPEDLISVIKSIIVPAAKQAYDQRVEGLEFFIFRFTYSKIIKDGGVEKEIVSGISAPRIRIRNWDQFEDGILNVIYDKIRDNFQSYLEKSVDGTISTVGFVLENLFETQSGEI